jgi:coniferyl-aldehyde dehydrogenase
MLVLQEEIFGPILPVLAYGQIGDALEYVNRKPRPLALYLFSYNGALQRLVAERTHSGGLSINDTMTHAGVDDIPFGGIGESGIGQYHGRDGFITFSKAKGTFSKGRFNGGRMVYAPYGGFLQRMAMQMSLR